MGFPPDSDARGPGPPSDHLVFLMMLLLFLTRLWGAVGEPYLERKMGASSRARVAILTAFVPQPCELERGAHNRASCRRRNAVFKRGLSNHKAYAAVHNYAHLDPAQCAVKPAIAQPLGFAHPNPRGKVFMLQACIQAHYPHIEWFLWVVRARDAR